MKKVLAALLLAVIQLSAFGLEVREGRLKLFLHESTGRFSLYYLSDIQKDRYEPLFVDKDPRTSFLSLLIDDRAHRLGESPSFRTRAEKTETGARFVFESSTLVALQNFSFAGSAGSALADTLRIDFSLTNKSDRELSVGLRLLVDTNLAEKKSGHFKTDLREISSEYVLLTATEGDLWWSSEADGMGLMGSVRADGLEAPDSIHFANWKRLNDAPWKAQSSAGRNFNLLPYSIGDSALSYYFDPKPVPRGSERKLSVLLGASKPAGFAGIGAATAGGLSQILKTSVEAASSPDLARRTDLVTVRDLLARVDQLLGSPDSVSDEELIALESIIERLKVRNPDR